MAKSKRLYEDISSAVFSLWQSTRIALEVETFCAFIDTECEVPWMSIALPAARMLSRRQALSAVVRLKALFEERKRKLRFEIVEQCWPGIPEILLCSGLKQTERAPIMICTPGSFCKSPTKMPVGLVTHTSSENEIVRYVATQREAYGVTDSAVSLEQEAGALRRDIANQRNVCATVELSGEPAGCALTMGFGGVCELAGVGTIAKYRRRGVGLSVSSFLLERHFLSGGRFAWLTPGGPESEALYKKLGFSRIGAYQLNFEIDE